MIKETSNWIIWNIYASIRKIVDFIDIALDRLYSRHNNPHLIILGFHAVYLNEKNIERGLLDEEQLISIQNCSKVIQFFQKKGYKFVSPLDILENRYSSLKNILITFDDGYYNNIFIYPLLQEYKVPALFFISLDNLLYQNGFWWDVLYRENKKINVSDMNIFKERKWLKTQSYPDIEYYLKERFGKDCIHPISDFDRPFTISELAEFSKNNLVYLGNHTMNHSILTLYEDYDIDFQIGECQKRLSDIMGDLPNFIAYPNGDFSDKIIDHAQKYGIKFGITTEEKKKLFTLSRLRKNAIGKIYSKR
jgi:Predicted xylanase/chitin deacetylase